MPSPALLYRPTSIAVVLLATFAVLASVMFAVHGIWLLVGLVGSAILMPRVWRSGDLADRRRYARWRGGCTPRRRTIPRRRWQLSIRAALLIMTLCALFVSYLQPGSPTSLFLVGIGCVATGILVGALDYEPRGIGALRGKAYSGAIGGVCGAGIFGCFVILVGWTADRTAMDAWFLQSLGRLTLFWCCAGAFIGAGFGLWAAARIYRDVDSTDPRPVTPARPPKVTTPPRPYAKPNSGHDSWDLVPAAVASILLHLTVLVSRSGMFDVGSAYQLTSREEYPTEELRISATLARPELSELQVSPLTITSANSTPSPEPSASSEVPFPPAAPLFVPAESTTAGAESPSTGQGVSDRPSDHADEDVIHGVGEAVGLSASSALDIPLKDQTVVVQTGSGGGVRVGGVRRLTIQADGSRVRVEFEPPGPILAVDFPATFVNVEYQPTEGQEFRSLPVQPHIRLAYSHTAGRPGAGEARIRIDASDGRGRSYTRASRQASRRVTREGSLAAESGSASAGVLGENLLNNGGFERPQVGYGWTDMEAGGGEFAWTITKPRVEMKKGFWEGVSERGRLRRPPSLPKKRPSYGRRAGASGGDQSVDMDYGAIMHQDFATVPGRTYQLSFWYSHNPDRGNRSSSGVVRVLGNRQLLHKTLTHNAKSTLADMKFKQFVGVFQADSFKTRLQFESLQPSVFGFVLDDVRVTARP